MTTTETLPTNDDTTNTNNTKSWETEGMRRVRANAVLNRMHYLTGMAAIGGFLFGCKLYLVGLLLI